MSRVCLIRLVRRFYVSFSVSYRSSYLLQMLSLFFSSGWGVITTVVWLVGIALGALKLLPIYDIFDLKYDIVAYSVLIALSLLLICFSYLKTHKDPFHCNRCICDTLALQQALCNWPVFCARACSLILLNYIFCMFYLTRSLINPIMYSLRMPLHCILQELKNKLKVPHWRSKNCHYTVFCKNLKISWRFHTGDRKISQRQRLN